MSEDTKKILECIYNITNNIFFLYTMLIKMEILGKQQTKEYNNIIELLLLAKEEEEELYFILLDTVEERNNISEFLAKDTYDIAELDNIGLITHQNPHNLIKSRISCMYNGFTLDFLDQDFIFVPYIKNMQAALNKTTTVRMASYLERVIKLTTNSTVKNYLIHARLYLSFLDSYLEEQYINNGFQKVPNIFDQEINIGSEISPEITKSMKETHGIKIMLRAVEELFIFDEEDFSDPINFSESLILLGLIQTSTLYFSNAGLKATQKEIYKTLEKFKSYEPNKQYSCLESVFKIAFNSVEDIKKRANSDLDKSKGY